MYDFWFGDVNLAPILLFLAIFVIFPGQLVLCFKTKSRMIRLLPTIVLSVVTTAAVIAACVCMGWDIVFYIVSAIYLAIMLHLCGAAWAIWAIVRLFLLRKRKS